MSSLNDIYARMAMLRIQEEQQAQLDQAQADLQSAQDSMSQDTVDSVNTDSGTTIDLNSNIMTLRDGTTIDITTGMKVDPVTTCLTRRITSFTRRRRRNATSSAPPRSASPLAGSPIRPARRWCRVSQPCGSTSIVVGMPKARPIDLRSWNTLALGSAKIGKLADADLARETPSACRRRGCRC